MITRYILEWCPVCHTTVGQIPVMDEPEEDCNFFGELKDYKLNQRGLAPYKCSCGTCLIPKES